MLVHHIYQRYSTRNVRDLFYEWIVRVQRADSGPKYGAIVDVLGVCLWMLLCLQIKRSLILLRHRSKEHYRKITTTTTTTVASKEHCCI